MKVLRCVICLLVVLPAARLGAHDLAREEQVAWQTAAESVAPTVVQIRTVGGQERVGKTYVNPGPTTGLIVTADGYIVSSAINFAGEPTSILVRLPDGSSAAAKRVAHDKNRLLVLLKVDVDTPLPVPPAVPREEFRVGRWAIALGRTWREDRVGISTGIISGLNRRYGRVFQVDCSVSPANYGGPVIDLQGRVYGILVPMAPAPIGAADHEELAGVENYDSGIGFAVPLVDVLEVLPRWQQGEDLLPGKLGIGLITGGAHLAPPRIGSVWPNSPADAADWQPGDLILAVGDVPLATQAHFHFQLVPRYAGETLEVRLERAGRQLTSRVTLAAELGPWQHAFLGILPSREVSGPDQRGVPVRGVWPHSPAAQAGVQAGDRLLHIDTQQATVDQVRPILQQRHPDEKVELVLLRQGQELTRTVPLATLPHPLLTAEDLPPATPHSASEPATLVPLQLPAFSQTANFYRPESASAGRAGLLVWLSDGSAAQDQQLLASWQASCRRDGLILLLAHPAEAARWQSADLKYLTALVAHAGDRFGTDAHRTVIGGSGRAGQLAFAVALREQQDFAGAIGLDAPLLRTQVIPATQPQERVALLAVAAKDSAWAPLLRRDWQRLRTAGYSASWLPQSPYAAETELETNVQATIARWIDTLDRF